jgi:hypothetical protein
VALLGIGRRGVGPRAARGLSPLLHFDIESIAHLNARSVERLLSNPGIVRHRGKIESTPEDEFRP